MRGVQPPPLGSPKADLYARMFLMEQSQQYESLSTMAMVVATAIGVSKEKADSIFRILETYEKSLAFKRWSVEAKKQKIQEAQTEQDLLKKVAELGRS